MGDYESLVSKATEFLEVSGDQVALPAFVDCHTHICFGGNRANDFSMRNAGKSYLEIAEVGGGIWSSVEHTRKASEEELLESLLQRIEFLSLGNVPALQPRVVA